ncbi:hypothetical protein [Lacihabitans soyangensis]|uniref:Uncharacterized protein n=1 Tax=Lacihabitans soyangensis TaxID=869394 RepID=A0AAE3H291_9BACT|nr:hypothetical protein [Lacihabitans soyangensis]MCP9762965.1 hypothetical protein [Lacihabitans soyangensis]
MKSANFLELLNSLCGEYAYSSSSFLDYLEAFPLYKPSISNYVLGIIDKVEAGNFTREEYEEYSSWVFHDSDRVDFNSQGEEIIVTSDDLRSRFYTDLNLRIIEELQTSYQKLYNSLRTLGSLKEIQDEVNFWQIEVEKYIATYKNVQDKLDYSQIYKDVTSKLEVFSTELNFFTTHQSSTTYIFDSYPKWGDMPSWVFYKILEKLVFTDDAGFISRSDYDRFVIMALSGYKNTKIKLGKFNKGEFVKPFCLLKVANEDLFSAKHSYLPYLDLITQCFDVDWSAPKVKEVMKKRMSKVRTSNPTPELKASYLRA